MRPPQDWMPEKPISEKLGKAEGAETEGTAEEAEEAETEGTAEEAETAEDTGRRPGVFGLR